MSADRLLKTVLQHFPDVHDDAKTDQIIGSTTHLLTRLSNPLNLGVLTSQLLSAPAIWDRDDGLRTAVRVIGIYSTAATRVHNDAVDKANGKPSLEAGGLRCDDWVRAVVQGADDRSKRWQHLLVLTGVLVGMGGRAQSLSSTMRHKLETAVVTAANLAMNGYAHDGAMAGTCIVLGLSFALPLLSDFNKSQLNADVLLPLTTWVMTGIEGFHSGRFLDNVNRETVPTPQGLFVWSAQSPSFRMIQELDSRPLMANMGPVSKLAAFAALHANDTRAALQAQDVLLEFTLAVLSSWQGTKLSEIDTVSEKAMLSPETLQSTWPALWQFLRKLMFATVVTLQAIISRGLLDPRMLNQSVASGIAAKTLHALRNLYFVSSRNGNNSFQLYEFTYLTSIDIISRDPAACEAFLKATQPSGFGSAQSDNVKRTLDLFYLNVAEHFPLALSTEACDGLIITPATAYLSHSGPMPASVAEVFESAHSAILSTLSCPQHSALTIRVAPFYIVKLFESFPSQISPRQFRVAFKTVMQIVSPPFPIAAMNPHMSETLLEMLRASMSHAATTPLVTFSASVPATEAKAGIEDILSEQSTLALTLVDSLPFLPLPLVAEWLTITAESLHEIADPMLRRPVVQRFQEILVSGEMDVERATIAVAWWGTRGGRELLASGRRPEEVMMSGANGSNMELSKL